MHVDEPRGDDEARHLDDLNTCIGPSSGAGFPVPQRRADVGYLAVYDEDIPDGIEIPGGIDDPSPFE
jgi:hypothetical protein